MIHSCGAATPAAGGKPLFMRMFGPANGGPLRGLTYAAIPGFSTDFVDNGEDNLGMRVWDPLTIRLGLPLSEFQSLNRHDDMAQGMMRRLPSCCGV